MAFQRGSEESRARQDFILRVMSMWPTLSLAGRGALADLAKRMGYDLTDILSQLNLAEGGVTAGARWLPPVQG